MAVRIKVGCTVKDIYHIEVVRIKVRCGQGYKSDRGGRSQVGPYRDTDKDFYKAVYVRIKVGYSQDYRVKAVRVR